LIIVRRDDQIINNKANHPGRTTSKGGNLADRMGDFRNSQPMPANGGANGGMIALTL
jgi:hypothetical protein